MYYIPFALKGGIELYTGGKTHLFSFDVETDGLYGEAFAFGVTIWELASTKLIASVGGYAKLDEVSNPWVKENIVPILTSEEKKLFSVYSTRQNLRNAFWDCYMKYRDSSIILGDFQSPCEATFMRQCVLDDLKTREWLGPYPLHELGTIMALADIDPDLDRFEFTNQKYLTKHNPIHDSLTAASTYFIIQNPTMYYDKLINHMS